MVRFEYHNRRAYGDYRPGLSEEITVYERDDEGVLRFLAHVPVRCNNQVCDLEAAIVDAIDNGILPDTPSNDVTWFSLDRIPDSDKRVAIAGLREIHRSSGKD